MANQQWHSITQRTTGGRGRFAASCLCAAILCVASGCRSGTTAFSAPSWWSFGGSGAADPSKLASAPPFDGQAADGKIEKPSQSATPYPTTTTPNGYVVNEAARGPSTDPKDPASAASVPAAVTYGTTPPPASTAQAPASPAGGSLSSIAPQVDSSRQPSTPAGAAQVGPYASLAGQIPTAGSQQPLVPPPLSPAVSPPQQAPLAAAPAPGAFPATAGYEPASRYASNAGTDSLGQSPPAAPPSAEPAGMSRYGSATGSRFGGGLEPPPPAAPTAPAAPAASGFQPASGLPAAAPPTRRPDPGYRPGGTSSYRPSRAILVDDEAAAPSAVRTAGYEVPSATSP